ncbi:MAG: RIP metalloprotease RseP [Candidatus Omnitrophica bacterium]|nr:RIP metalloprotease RseP [Candidatus Omnitrophota bacterium]
MITLIIFIAVLSILIIVHEFGHFMMAKKVGVRVERFSLGFGPVLFSRKGKETEFVLCAIPLGGYVKLAGDSLEEFKGGKDEYFTMPVIKRFGIVFFGPLLNYALGLACFWLIFIAGYPTLTTKVGGLVDGYGAKKAGILAGDKIVSIDSKKVETWEDIQKIIQSEKANASVKIVLVREAKKLDLEVNIREKSVDDALGQKRNVGILGIIPSDETMVVKHGFFQAPVLALNKTWELTALTYKAIWRLILGKLSMRDSVTGPLGMFYITSKVASLGIIALIHFLATLSISLCLFNLLPIPALDGGHLVLLLIEKIRGKGISLKAEHIFTQIGYALIIALAVTVTYNDILRLFGDKISRFFK